jgi:hypothetical protein
MDPRDQLIVRRSAIADGDLRRRVPTAVIYRALDFDPLEELVKDLNQPGRLPTGLRAHAEHLVVRAAAKAAADHPHFTSLILPGGAVYHADQIVASLSIHGPGGEVFAIVSEPGGRAIDEMIAEIDAAVLDGRERHDAQKRKDVMRHRHRPLVDCLLNGALIGSLVWLRDRFRLPDAWINTAVNMTGNLVVHSGLGSGATSMSLSLTGPRVAQVLVGAEQNEILAADGRVVRVLQLGLAYDLRLFDAFEAAAFLDRLDPAESLA